MDDPSVRVDRLLRALLRDGRTLDRLSWLLVIVAAVYFAGSVALR